MTKDTTRHLFLVFAISVGLLLPLSFAPLNADEVKYCFRSGPAKSILAQYDDEVRLLSQQQLIDAEKTHLPYGFPTMCPLRLFNPYYINCYDTVRRVPAWSAYRLEGSDVQRAAQEGARRAESFRTDPRLTPEQSASCEDYAKQRVWVGDADRTANYYQARGHSAPDNDFRHSARAQAYTYYLSNMTPQWQRFNGGTWLALETYTRQAAQTYGSVQVITGPLFAQRDDWMEPTKRVAVPQEYFRILLRQDGGAVRALVFILPNWKEGRPDGDTRRTAAILQDHLRSIKDVIDAAGADLFPDMDAADKDRLGRQPERVLWSVAQQ